MALIQRVSYMSTRREVPSRVARRSHHFHPDSAEKPNITQGKDSSSALRENIRSSPRATRRVAVTPRTERGQEIHIEERKQADIDDAIRYDALLEELTHAPGESMDQNLIPKGQRRFGAALRKGLRSFLTKAGPEEAEGEILPRSSRATDPGAPAVRVFSIRETSIYTIHCVSRPTPNFHPNALQIVRTRPSKPTSSLLLPGHSSEVVVALRRIEMALECRARVHQTNDKLNNIRKRLPLLLLEAREAGVDPLAVLPEVWHQVVAKVMDPLPALPEVSLCC